MNNGCAVVEGNMATAKASMSRGVYQVGWRAVSSDGHPISGSFRFEVVNSTATRLTQTTFSPLAQTRMTQRRD
jgi:hypothetical protein